MAQTGKITALYCRYSADDNMRSESDSIAHQKAILTEYANNHGAEMVIISAKIEEELAELGADEAKEYLNDLGIEVSPHRSAANANSSSHTSIGLPPQAGCEAQHLLQKGNR